MRHRSTTSHPTDPADTPDPPPNWATLGTEAQLAGSRGLDQFSTAEAVAAVLREDKAGLDQAARLSNEIAAVADWFAETLQGDGDAVFVGAGTSGRLGVIEAAECPPTFGTDPSRIRALIAGGPAAVFAAREGAEDDRDAGRRDAEGLGVGDLVIGISASAVTRYVDGALSAARDAGARTVLLTCAAPGRFDDRADRVLALDTGAEVLTGSTRLKAGSATKAVLNAITTAAMVRLGKVFDNLMVDLRPGSAKLRDRAVRIIACAGDVSLDEGRRLHHVTDGDVKVAIIMARTGVTRDEARQRLEHAEGHIRRAIEA